MLIWYKTYSIFTLFLPCSYGVVVFCVMLFYFVAVSRYIKELGVTPVLIFNEVFRKIVWKSPKRDVLIFYVTQQKQIDKSENFEPFKLGIKTILLTYRNIVFNYFV